MGAPPIVEERPFEDAIGARWSGFPDATHDLAALAERHRDTRVTWIIRRPATDQMIGGKPNDQLPNAVGSAPTRSTPSSTGQSNSSPGSVLSGSSTASSTPPASTPTCYRSPELRVEVDTALRRLGPPSRLGSGASCRAARSPSERGPHGSWSVDQRDSRLAGLFATGCCRASPSCRRWSSWQWLTSWGRPSSW